MDDSKQESQGTYSGQISGLRWEAERCPDATSGDSLKATAIGGGGAWLGALFMGLPPHLRLVAAAGGALVGHLASTFHLNVDWDPDSLFDDDRPSRRPSDADPDVRPL